MKMGPNNASGIVWALSEFFSHFFIFFFSILTNILWHIQDFIYKIRDRESDGGWQQPKQAQTMLDASFGHQMSNLFFFFVFFATNENFIVYISSNLQNMQQRSYGGWQRPKQAQTMHLALFGPQVSFSFLFIYFSTLTKMLQYMQAVIY